MKTIDDSDLSNLTRAERREYDRIRKVVADAEAKLFLEAQERGTFPTPRQMLCRMLDATRQRVFAQ